MYFLRSLAMITHRSQTLLHPCIIQLSLTQCLRPACMAYLNPGADCTDRHTAAACGARRPRGGFARERGRGRGIFLAISSSDPHSEFPLQLCISVHSGYVSHSQVSSIVYHTIKLCVHRGYRIMFLAPFLISHFSSYFFS